MNFRLKLSMMAYKYNNGPGILRLEARMSKFLLLKYLKPSLWAVRQFQTKNTIVL